METAKASGLEPYAYIKHVLTALPSAQTLEDVEALLLLTRSPQHLMLFEALTKLVD